MDGYAQLSISAEQLKGLVGSADYKDRIMAATELRSLAESNRVGTLDNDFVVTCVSEQFDKESDGRRVRCYSMGAGEISEFVVPSEKPYASCLGSMIKAHMGSSLIGRLVLLSEEGQVLWQDESWEVRAVLQTLAGDADDHVLIATVAAFVALVASDDVELSGFAILELHRLVLSGAVPDMEVLTEAFEAIRMAAEHGSQPGVDVFIESLQHDVPMVRLLAVVGLEAPAKSGNMRALAALLLAVCDAELQVRREISDVLASVLQAVEDGSEAPRSALAAQIDTIFEVLAQSPTICTELVVALGAAAGNGHAEALQKLLHLAQESDEEVARSAVRGLGIAAMRGISGTFETLTCIAEGDADDSIRMQAVSAMGTMVQDGKMQVAVGLARIAQNSCDQNIFVRLEAIKGLGPAIAAGNEVARTALLDLMTTPNKFIRRAVVEVFTSILSAAKLLELLRLESQGLVETVIGWQGDEDVMIRRAVVSCCSSLSEQGHIAVMNPLTIACKDSDEHIRRIAVRSLGELAQAGNENAVEHVLACAKDHSNLVRAQVAASVAALAKLGNHRAQDLLPVLEQDDNVLVSVAAQPGTHITSTVGDGVSVMRYSYDACRLMRHGLGAAALPMLRTAVEPGMAAPSVLGERGSERAITDALQEKLAQVKHFGNAV